MDQSRAQALPGGRGGQLNATLRMRVALFLTAGFTDMTKALKEHGVIGNDPEEERLAEQFLREATTAILFVADQDDKRLKADRDSGDYREAVEKLVDGVIEDVKAARYKDKVSAQSAVSSAVLANEYVVNPELHVQALKYGAHPSAFHYRRRTFSPVAPVPWQGMAHWCVHDDAHEELEMRPEYQALPRTSV